MLAALAGSHDIAFVALPGAAPQIRAHGFPIVVETEPADEAEHAALHERAYALPTVAEREDLLLRDGFAGIHARRQIPAVLRACAEWRPDLIVRDEADFGCAIAAEKVAIPCATTLVIASGSLMRNELLSEPLNALRAEHNLPEDPDLEMLRRDLVICPFPPGFRDPAYPLPPTAVTIRHHGLDSTPEDRLPEWIDELADAPVIYFSLGAEFNEERQDLFAPVIEGLRDLPVNFIVTVGRNLDPVTFGEQPANVHIERFVSQSLLPPYCDLVVTHGGSGTVMGALAQGLPMVIIPLGADQPLNAGRCADLGVGRVVEAEDVTPGRIRAAVEEVLSNPGYRLQAGRFRDEIASLPGPDYAVVLLEQVAGPTPAP